MIETIFLWSAIFIVAIAAINMPQLVNRWRGAHCVYGQIPWSLVRHMWRYARKSPMAYPLWSTAVCIPLTIVIVLRQLIHDDPYAFTFFCLAAMIFGLVKSAEVIVPPSILLLSSSTQDSASALALLNSAFPNYRTVAMLQPHERLSRAILQKFFYNNLRTRNNYEWRSVVFHLMDVVPVIVIDAMADNPAVAEERRRIERRGYMTRTASVVDHATNPMVSGREQILQVERVSLAAWIRNRLQTIDDFEKRMRRQAEFANILATVPSRLHDPQTVVEMIFKARFIEQYEKERFLRCCKGIEPEQWGGRLYEDIPSQVSREEERRFLRESRGLEEVEILLISALETVEQSSNSNREFNIANSYNSLGALARLQCNWEEAIRLINKAIRCLEPLVADLRHVDSDIRELATAYFNLGEVYMARFREHGQLDDRRRAAEHFQYSITLDQQLGSDTAVTKNLLHVL